MNAGVLEVALPWLYLCSKETLLGALFSNQPKLTNTIDNRNNLVKPQCCQLLKIKKLIESENNYS